MMKKKMDKEIMLGAFASYTRGMGTIGSVAKFNNVDSASFLEGAQSRVRDGRIWGLKKGLKGGKADVGKALNNKKVGAEAGKCVGVNVGKNPRRNTRGNDSRGKGMATSGIKDSVVSTK